MPNHSALLKDIEQYYLPRKLVAAIYERGEIPRFSQESRVGVGFIDIADYTFLSKFLSPMENQTLLNGLYTAFQAVLDSHGGYLNKIEGDSLMFQFDTVIMDPKLGVLPPQDIQRHIVKELFFTCVEMQRVCVFFNEAKEGFLLRKNIGLEGRKALQDAFAIIKTLRERPDLSESMSAFFQIRIRIGASLGDVTIGNFGPEGAKHWDIIGMPVIDAKRMESTSPVGGLRISEDYFKILDALGIADDYYRRFRREAHACGSRYAAITKEEIFSFKKVTLSEKKGAVYNTYAVQVNPQFPETLGKQIESLLDRGPMGADRIIQLIQYYRGNAYVVDHLEALFVEKGLKLRKASLLAILAPRKTAEWNGQGVDLETRFSLKKIFQILGRHQDSLKPVREESPSPFFLSYEQCMASTLRSVMAEYRRHRTSLIQRTHFHEVVVPLIYHSLRVSILEYQSRKTVKAEELQEL
jgi:class 3 adenylate cyclase